MKTAAQLFREVVVMMHGETCILCGSWANTVHHVYEKGMGGCTINQELNPLNGVPLCGKCHHHIHSVVGEVKGREAIFKARPALAEANYQTHPLFGETETEVRHELDGMLKQFRRSNVRPKNKRPD